MARTQVVLGALVELFIKLNQIDSLNSAKSMQKAAENLFSDFNQQEIQVAEQPVGRIATIIDSDSKRQQPSYKFTNSG